MHGKHLVGDLYDCECPPQWMTEGATAMRECVQRCRQLGLTVLDQCLQGFEGAGFTLAVLLAESHITLHTWPENQAVAMDVYVCNYTQDNGEKARDLAQWCSDFFRSRRPLLREIMRGDMHA